MRFSTLARAAGASGLGLLALLTAGCADMKGMPLAFEPRHTGIVVDPKPPAIVVVDPSGKPSPEVVGGLTGTGMGVAAGSALCLGTGPLFPLCMLTLMPTTAAVGAASGTLAGAAAASGPRPVEPQETLLAIGGPGGMSGVFAGHVQGQVQSVLQVAMPMVDQDGIARAGQGMAETAYEWLAIVRVSQVAAVKSPREQAFSIRVEATLSLRRPRDRVPVYIARHALLTAEERTFDEWGADEGRALRATLDESLRHLAAEVAADLSDPPGGVRRQVAPPVGYTH